MSSDLYVQSISKGSMRVRRRPHVSGEIAICFNDPAIKPITLTTDSIVNMADHGVTTYEIQRSNLRTLVSMGYVEVVL